MDSVSYSFPIMYNVAVKQDMEYIQTNLHKYNETLGIYENMKAKSQVKSWEISIIVLYPVLFVAGLALQIVTDCQRIFLD